ncbi:DUF4159 domain-containing protein [Acidisoma cladoniae]|jgi:hypothetical protein|uniref:DUF4159 domain-containing protein n=1 Tax=Acidisoma cladoniae TaxID=3040935 RepID=UPI00254DA39D|nr:DUF4159 domain-containing protein [Acidisoma sp. PAMC 29798]
MILAHPWLLVALAVLPLLWWLVRASPPAPRSQTFPALRLLADLRATEESPERTPPWLLLLRLLAAACLILGLANPILHPNPGLGGSGPVLIVLDNGWATAGDWPDRTAAAESAIAAAERVARPVALLATAPSADGRAPVIIGPMAAHDARARLAALAPLPWPSDRAAAIRALAGWNQAGTAVIAIDDAMAQPNDTAWHRALATAGAVTDIRAPVTAPLLLPPVIRNGHRVLRLAVAPQPIARSFAVLAQGSDGRTLDRVAIAVAAGDHSGEAPLGLPTDVANTISRLRLAGPPTAGGTILLDAQWQRRVVGLVATAGDAADAPLVGPLYYLDRALGPDVDIRRRPLATLLSQPLSVLILSDRPLPLGPERDAVTRFVQQGGLLIRFGGPMTALTPDPLLPVRLLQQDRSLGGALSWSKPEHLAPFPETGPFAGLAAPKDVTVSRQLLADPATLAATTVWATLTDGTPLVSSAAFGQGRIVLFHVTADADWSSLPLSGLFPLMLDRLVRLSSGTAPVDGAARLAPAETMNGYGELGPPNPAAVPIATDRLTTTRPSPQAPPGLYGPPSARIAFNLGAVLPSPQAASPIAGARNEILGTARTERALGPVLVALAMLLLIADLVASLALRGALRRRLALLALLLLLIPPAWSGTPDTAVPPAALETRLAYVVTGDSGVDRLSHDGLAGLSDFVTSRSSATLGAPVGVTPDQDDLSLYPLLYWPLLPGAPTPSARAVTALNRFMQDGGIILIDTEGNDTGAPGSGAGMQPGAAQTLRQAASGLNLPALAPLTSHDVLAHSFYLLRDFPGRYVGAPVWVARNEDASNDGVSPAIIGGNDWAAAWDMSQDGTFPYAMLPGGEQQRLLAYRFGMNLVMYALTGTYKGDQVHVPAILQRLGQ